MKRDSPPTAIVMNMFYTGLGIARSLGEHDVPVIGLSADRGVYGNFTRYAKTVFCPDSRTQPDELRDFLVALGGRMEQRAVIFPTRDDDLIFLDRFRGELRPYFNLAIPERPVLKACLNKWETYLAARRAGVPSPESWMIGNERDLMRVADEVTYPCVLKPASAHEWRQGDNWQIVGARKAIGISSREALVTEYQMIAKANPRALLQEMIPGGDESLMISACMLDADSRWVAGFNTQKLIQVPETFGTGCIVRAADCPELTAPTKRLMETMRFTGIAEVEYKWNNAVGEYQLIEINPRPWDQHRLGQTCGVDLVYLSYCEHVGLARPPLSARPPEYVWIAEDAFVNAALSLLWRRDSKLRILFRHARGKRIYPIWCIRDPLPFIAYFSRQFIPRLLTSGLTRVWRAFRRRIGWTKKGEKDLPYAAQLGSEESHR